MTDDEVRRLVDAGFRPANAEAKRRYRAWLGRVTASGPTTGNPKGGGEPAANPEPATATERNGSEPVKRLHH